VNPSAEYVQSAKTALAELNGQPKTVTWNATAGKHSDQKPKGTCFNTMCKPLHVVLRMRTTNRNLLS